MLLQIIGLKCDRLVNERGDTVELRQPRDTVAESARSEQYVVVWGPEEFGTRDQWELDHSVQGRSIDRSISFDDQIELSLVVADPSGGTPAKNGTVTIASETCDQSMSERRLLARFNERDHYTLYRGVTQESGGGFSEAYRYLLTGQRIPDYIDQAFADLTFNHPDHAGAVGKVIPTASSVNAARTAIAEHRQSVAAGEDQDCRIEQP